MKSEPDLGGPAEGLKAEDAGENTNTQLKISAEESRQEKAGNSRRSRLWQAALLVVLVIATFFLAWNHDYIADWFVLRSYKAPSSISQIAKADSMTAYGQRLFYVNKPKIEGQEAFNRACSSSAVGLDDVSVLGCYTGNRNGIYIYKVTEPELNGIQEVTAAHEMLHQAYDRLISSERKDINKQLEAYAKTITDKTLLGKIDAYKQDPSYEIMNEYHSIFGTEVSKLPSGLENYYKRYFNDRSKVVALHSQYQAAFTERIKKIEAYDKQLESLKTHIDSNKDEIQTQESALKARRAELDVLLRTDVPAYNAAVPGYNQQVENYKALVSQTNQFVSEYNQLVEQRNQLAVEEQALQRAIDSRGTSNASEQ